jgi:hypothetical protein
LYWLRKRIKKRYRFAIDYLKLNSITQKQVYQLLLIQEIVEQVPGKSLFSCVDFKSGFHQIEMYSDHIHYRALIYFPGLFEFLRFRLKGAPETF